MVDATFRDLPKEDFDGCFVGEVKLASLDPVCRIGTYRRHNLRCLSAKYGGAVRATKIGTSVLAASSFSALRLTIKASPPWQTHSFCQD